MDEFILDRDAGIWAVHVRLDMSKLHIWHHVMEFLSQEHDFAIQNDGRTKYKALISTSEMSGVVSMGSIKGERMLMVSCIDEHPSGSARARAMLEFASTTLFAALRVRDVLMSTAVATAATVPSDDGLLPVSNTDTRRIRMRNQVANELYNTECAYVRDVTTLLTVYIEPLRQIVASRNDTRNGVLSNLLDGSLLRSLIDIHSGFVRTLRARFDFTLRGQDDRLALGTCLRALVMTTDFERVYKSYCADYVAWGNALRTLRESSNRARKRLATSLTACDGRNIDTMLIVPVQRLCKYPLLLRELIRSFDNDDGTVDDDDDMRDAQAALEHVQQRTNSINEHQRAADVAGAMHALYEQVDGLHALNMTPYDVSAMQRRRLVDTIVLSELTLSDGTSTLSALSTSKSARTLRKARNVFYALFDDMLLRAGGRSNGGGGGGSSPAFVLGYIMPIQHVAIAALPDIGALRNAAEVTFSESHAWYVLFETSAKRSQWIAEIDKAKERIASGQCAALSIPDVQPHAAALASRISLRRTLSLPGRKTASTAATPPLPPPPPPPSTAPFRSTVSMALTAQISIDSAVDDDDDDDDKTTHVLTHVPQPPPPRP